MSEEWQIKCNCGTVTTSIKPDSEHWNKINSREFKRKRDCMACGGKVHIFRV